MPRGKKVLSIAELERALADKQKQLRTLTVDRDSLLKRLGRVDAQIAALNGRAAPAKASAPVRVAAPKAKAVTKAGRRGRATGKPLGDYIAAALAKSSAPMRAKNVEIAVRAAGYPTKSKDFYTQVATALAGDKRFKRISRGIYKMARK